MWAKTGRNCFVTGRCCRYALIADMEPGSGANLKVCKGIIKQMGFPDENIQIGKTKVLYRAAEYRKLELDWSIKMKHKTINDNLETMSKTSTSGMSRDEKEKFFMKLAKVCTRSCPLLSTLVITS